MDLLGLANFQKEQIYEFWLTASYDILNSGCLGHVKQG